MPKISFLILTFNSSSYISNLFDSLFKNLGNEIERGDVEIIVHDNNSTDDTIQILEEFSGRKNANSIVVSKSDKNEGYAKGINKAASLAKADLLVVVNPDSELLELDLEGIVNEFAENKRLAIAGLKIVDFTGKIEKTAGKFFNPLSFLGFCFGFEDAIGLRYSPSIKKKVDFVSGGFVVFRNGEFLKLGGYDEDYFMYVEDMDICYRAKKEGLQVWFLPLAVIRHKGQGSSNREFAIVNIYKGLQIFYTKHGSFLMAFYIKNLLTLKAALIIFIGAILGKKELVATYTKALHSIV